MRLDVGDPAHLRALHIGGYWRGPNDSVRHIMLGLARTGAAVHEFDTDAHPQALDTEGRPYDRGRFGPVWLRWEVLGPLVETLDPHLIVCNAGGLAFRPPDALRLRQGRTVLGIALSDPDVFGPSTSVISPLFDLFLTNAPDCVARHAEGGARARVMPVGTNDEFYRPVPPRPEMRCEVLVLGRAHPDRVEPVQALVRAFDTHVYGESWEAHGVQSRGTIYGDDVLAALNSAAVTVVFFRTEAGHALVKVGLFDFAAAGALVVTNRFPEVEAYFEYGRELAGFEGTADLLATVRHLLDHPQEAAAIRRAGRERVLRDHTWARIWPRILGWLSEGEGGRA